MPTNNRVNISLVGENIVPDLLQLRKTLEELTGKRLSLADVLKALIVTRHSDNHLAKLINS